MSIFNDPIIISLSARDPLVYLQTYDPKHGWSQRFYLSSEALYSQLNGEGSVTECDLLNVCTVARFRDNVRFHALWLHGNYDNDVCGYQQTFYIPTDKVAKALAGESIKHLAYTPICQPKADIFFTQTAHKAIAEADKLKRHAIRRFFRDNFDYGRDEHLVVQREEWINGFYFFSTVSHCEGGIVLHETEVKGTDGKLHRKIYYGLHT